MGEKRCIHKKIIKTDWNNNNMEIMRLGIYILFICNHGKGTYADSFPGFSMFIYAE